MLIQGLDYFVDEVQKWFDQCESLTVFGVIPNQGASVQRGFMCDNLSKDDKLICVHHVQTGGSPVASGRSMEI